MASGEDLVLRPMVANDVEAVALLEEAYFSMPWSRKAFYDALQRENTIYLVMARKEKILGYLGAWCAMDEVEIVQVAVSIEGRRQGIGLALLEGLEKEGALRGMHSYFLEVRESNGAAIGLYEKAGFEQLGIRKNFYERPVENGIVMRKETC